MIYPKGQGGAAGGIYIWICTLSSYPDSKLSDAVLEGLFGAFGLDAEKEKVREQAAREEKLYRMKLFEPDLKFLSAATDRRMRRAWTNDLFCSLRMPSTGALLAARALRRSRYGGDELGLPC